MLTFVFYTGRIGGSGEGMLFMSQDAGLNWTAVSYILYFSSLLSTLLSFWVIMAVIIKMYAYLENLEGQEWEQSHRVVF